MDTQNTGKTPATPSLLEANWVCFPSGCLAVGRDSPLVACLRDGGSSTSKAKAPTGRKPGGNRNCGLVQSNPLVFCSNQPMGNETNGSNSRGKPLVFVCSHPLQGASCNLRPNAVGINDHGDLADMIHHQKAYPLGLTDSTQKG